MEDKRTTRAREQFYNGLEKEGFTLAKGNDFVNSGTYLHVVCPEGHTIKTCPNKFQQGRRCPHCSKKVKKTTEDFKKEVEDLVGDEYCILGEYKRANDAILMKHNECGKEIMMSRTNFLKGKRCRDCSYKKNGLNRRFTQKELERRVSELGDGEYVLQSQYETSNKQVLLKHKVCGSEWLNFPNNFLHHGIVCPNCTHIKSKGEDLVKEYFDNNNIKYKFQFTFEDLKDKRKLAYDFGVFNESGYLTYLVEYDGEQHFRPVEYFGGVEGFKKSQHRDNLKNKYALKNGIKLIRIAYNEDVYEKLKEVHNEHYKQN